MSFVRIVMLSVECVYHICPCELTRIKMCPMWGIVTVRRWVRKDELQKDPWFEYKCWHFLSSQSLSVSRACDLVIPLSRGGKKQSIFTEVLYLSTNLRYFTWIISFLYNFILHCICLTTSVMTYFLQITSFHTLPVLWKPCISQFLINWRIRCSFMAEKILLLLKLNKLFKNPLGFTGKCIITKLKTGLSSWAHEKWTL